MRLSRFFIAAALSALTFSCAAHTPTAEGNAKNCVDNQEKCEAPKELNRMQKSFRNACENDPEACRYRQQKARERREAQARKEAAENQ